MKPLNRKQQRLVEANLNLVQAIVHKQCQSTLIGTLDKEDLYQYGCIGLCSAASRWSEDRGSKFTTFAWPFIKGRILQAIRDKSFYIKPPRKLLEKFGTQIKAMYADGTDPEDIAIALELDVIDVIAIIESNNNVISLDTFYEDGELQISGC